jgi:hypothetical protein
MRRCKCIGFTLMILTCAEQVMAWHMLLGHEMRVFKYFHIDRIILTCADTAEQAMAWHALLRYDSGGANKLIYQS